MLHLIDEYRGSGGPGDTGIPQIQVYTGGRGRPAYYIPQSQIEAMMELRFTYEKMAALLHISTRTLQRHRQEYGLPIGRNYTNITDDELDATIRSILQVGCPPPMMCSRLIVCVCVRLSRPFSCDLQRVHIICSSVYSIYSKFVTWLWLSLVPSPLCRERKGSGQTCIEPVLLVQSRVCANQIRVLQSHDVKNAINSHCTRLCELKIAIARPI